MAQQLLGFFYMTECKYVCLVITTRQIQYLQALAIPVQMQSPEKGTITKQANITVI